MGGYWGLAVEEGAGGKGWVVAVVAARTMAHTQPASISSRACRAVPSLPCICMGSLLGRRHGLVLQGAVSAPCSALLHGTCLLSLLLLLLSAVCSLLSADLLCACSQHLGLKV